MSQWLSSLKDGIVHFPEFSLSASRLCSFRRRLRVRVHGGQRKVPENEEQSLSELSLDLPNHPVRPDAMRAFVVTVFNQNDAGRSITKGVIAFADGKCQSGVVRKAQ